MRANRMRNRHADMSTYHNQIRTKSSASSNTHLHIMHRWLVGAALVSICILGPQTAHSQDQAAVAAQSLSTPGIMQRDQQRSKQLSPDDRARAIKLFDQAFALYQAGDFDSAKLGFERGLGIDPANGLANYYLGEILARRNDNDGAYMRYERAIFFDSDSAEGLKAQTALAKFQAARREKAVAAENTRKRSEQLALQRLAIIKQASDVYELKREWRQTKQRIENAKCVKDEGAHCAQYAHETETDRQDRVNCLLGESAYYNAVEYNIVNSTSELATPDQIEACKKLKYIIQNLDQSMKRYSVEYAQFKMGRYQYGSWDLMPPPK